MQIDEFVELVLTNMSDAHNRIRIAENAVLEIDINPDVIVAALNLTIPVLEKARDAAVTYSKEQKEVASPQTPD